MFWSLGVAVLSLGLGDCGVEVCASACGVGFVIGSWETETSLHFERPCPLRFTAYGLQWRSQGTRPAASKPSIPNHDRSFVRH